jgi:MoxR-like ATPase
MIAGGRVRALAQGRAHLSFEDVQYFAREVLQHRVLLNYDGQAENIDIRELVRSTVEQVPEDMV